MKIELLINGIKKTVTISSNDTKGLRDEYTEKILDMEEASQDDNLTTREKMKKAREVFDWVETVALEKSNLTEEDKEIVKNNVELSDILSNAMRSLLQPVPTEEKKS